MLKEENTTNDYKGIGFTLIVIGIIYFIIWILFIGEGPLPTGEGLDKSDWLSYIISAVGGLITIFLGVIVYLQNNKIKKIYSEANVISKKMFELERNKVRPYIEIYDDDIDFAVSKATYGFSDEYYNSINANTKFEGTAFDDERKINSIYPSTLLFAFDIENTGHAYITELYLSRFSLLDGNIGDIKGFISIKTNSSLVKGKHKVLIEIKKQIDFENITENNVELCNKITNHYKESLNKNIRMGFLELGFKYTDIYGEEYEQEYTIHYGYDLEKETDNEMIFKLTQMVIEHHTGLSPYGPRDI